MAFCDKLRELRQQNKLSQEQLATKLNVSRQAISKWETGSIPDVDNIVKIANFFDCSLDYLMDLDTEMKGNSQSVRVNSVRKPENIALMFSFIGIVCLSILWIVSRFVNVDFCRQDSETGTWYVGFRAFIEYYRLYPLIFVSILSWGLGITIRFLIQFRMYQICGHKKCIFFRVVTYGLYVLGTVGWLIGFLRANGFNWSIGALIVIIIYILLTFCSICALFYFERGDM